MSTVTLFISAMTVFFLMLVGIVLTVMEFKYGTPRQREAAAKKNRNTKDIDESDGLVAIETRQL